MKRYFVFLLFFISFGYAIKAQDYNEPYNAKRQSGLDSKFMVGGGLGFSLGGVNMVDISPMLGYAFTKNFITGFGLTYKYYNIKDYYVVQTNNAFEYYDLKGNILGGSIFSRFIFARDLLAESNSLFLHSEYEILNYSFDDYYLEQGTVQKERTQKIYGSLLGGPGINFHITPQSFISIAFLYNFSSVEQSPYNEWVPKINFLIGL